MGQKAAVEVIRQCIDNYNEIYGNRNKENPKRVEINGGFLGKYLAASVRKNNAYPRKHGMPPPRSPRRRELLGLITDDFKVIPATGEENIPEGTSPEDLSIGSPEAT